MKGASCFLAPILTLVLTSSALAQPVTSPSPASAITAEPTSSPQMQGMMQMGDMDSMKRMADMCQEMMQREKAAMPFIIGISVLFGVLLFVALVLLIVLEIQWIKYWRHLLRTWIELARREHRQPECLRIGRGLR